jgi:DmsE family decaheme c-type cytochrome
MKLRRAFKLVLVSSALLTLLATLAGGVNRPKSQNAVQKGAAPAASSSSTTMEDCAACHEDVVKAFTRNPHSALQKSPLYNVPNPCESCHGPGEAHIAAGGDKAKIITFKGKVKGEYSKQCLSCHNKNHEVEGFAATMHAKSGLTCSDCHRVHSSAPMTKLLKQENNTLCFSCHTLQRAQFSKPFHHRVIEKAMNCLDCHQPHSGVEHHQVRTTSFGEMPCLKCHAEKEGPFVFEHAPLVIRNCYACHEPHGSNNPKMLVRSSVFLMCLECHAGSTNITGNLPPSFHDVRQPRYQNCTTCHTKIHGSNIDELFFR